jgi:hypothetical protein
MGLVVGLVAAGGCGAGLKVPDAREAARASLTDASGDPAAVAELLHDSVTVGQLIFDDATCAAAFPPGDVRQDKCGELARCLAGLRLRPSTREDGLGDVAVMSYGPGFEVEARILQLGSRSQLTWIGFASQHAGAPSVPTLDPAAFEALRAGGQRVPVLDAATARAIEGELSPTDPEEVAMVWLKVCLDETGHVTLIDPYMPRSYVAMDAFIAIAQAWTFRPFVYAGKAQPACSMVRMVHPAEKAPPVETLPLPPPPSQSKRPPLSIAQRRFNTLMEGKRIAGERKLVPDDETKRQLAQLRGRKVTGTYRLCLDEAGGVESVLPMTSTGLPAYDRDLLAGMARWRYSPYTIDGKPVPVCTQITFIYSQR